MCGAQDERGTVLRPRKPPNQASKCNCPEYSGNSRCKIHHYLIRVAKQVTAKQVTTGNPDGPAADQWTMGEWVPQNFPILVVDDDPVSRALVARYLSKAGFEVAAAANGKEALALFDQQFCPIVLTDWMMPEIDGPQLCRLLRGKKTDSYIYIILITARDSKTDIVSGLQSGADDYLTKPIHSAEMLARVNTGIRILNLEQSLKKANEEIRLLSITDSLTGCFNRAYLNERLPQELSRAKRYARPLSILIGDIDHFKLVNDTYGHQVGDRVLNSFSKIIFDQVRDKVDWVVRYGGEEFLVILPETDCAGARCVAERMRKAVEQHAFVGCDDQTLRITTSFGGACTCHAQSDPQHVTPDLMINQADEMLYLSKNQGRNRVNIIGIGS
jgi:two-component system, cell cycle response regulator